MKQKKARLLPGIFPRHGGKNRRRNSATNGYAICEYHRSFLRLFLEKDYPNFNLGQQIILPCQGRWIPASRGDGGGCLWQAMPQSSRGAQRRGDLPIVKVIMGLLRRLAGSHPLKNG